MTDHAAAPRVAAVVLAAGLSTRMAGRNKLLMDVKGRTMIARVVAAVLASRARPAIVVTGHEAERVRTALAAESVAFVHNPDYRQGMSASLRAGLGAVPADSDGAMICLADMPDVTAAAIDRLIAAFDPAERRAICVPTHNGQRGNPVLWARRFIPEMQALTGDTGARALITKHAGFVFEVAMDDAGVLFDVDGG